MINIKPYVVFCSSVPYNRRLMIYFYWWRWGRVALPVFQCFKVSIHDYFSNQYNHSSLYIVFFESFVNRNFQIPLAPIALAFSILLSQTLINSFVYSGFKNNAFGSDLFGFLLANISIAIPHECIL